MAKYFQSLAVEFSSNVR